MNNIKKIVLKIRNHLLKQDSLLGVFYIGIFYLIFFLFYIQLESIFYFSPNIKYNIIIFLAVSIIGLILLYGIQYYRATQGKIKKYTTKEISNSLGEKLYPNKKDKILNALQIESNIKKNESKELAKTFLNNISNDLYKINLIQLFKNDKIITIKQIFLIFLISIILIFSIRYEDSKYAFNRLIKPNKEFFAPKPFSLESLTGNLHILGGEIATININAINASPDTVILQLIPTQESIKARDSLKLEYFTMKDSNGIYEFELPKLFQDYSYKAIVKANYFWEAWEKVTSRPYTIHVTDRPDFANFQMIITPPKYSKLPKRKQEGNLSVIEALKGSRINIDLNSNRILESAHINFTNNKINMKTINKKASGYFDIVEENIFTINLFDKRGITNRDPIPYKIQLIQDQYPQLYVNKPQKDIELGTDQIISINLEIQDDFGFNSLQLAYEIHRPSYLKVEPFVSMKKINELNKDSLIQIIETFWDVEELNLMPQDEVHFHFELTDNDIISGPKKTISKKLIAKIPSIEDLYTNTEILEDSFIEDLKDELNKINELKEEWKDLELEAIKSSELTWEQKESIKNNIKKLKSELKNLEAISKEIESVSEQAEKHELFTPDLLNKLNELSELVSQIMPEDMLKNINDLDKAMENMDMESLNNAISELAENMDQIKEDLDRYLKVFKKLQAEQKMDELKNRIEHLLKQQTSLSEEINQLNQNIEPSLSERLKQEEKRILEELNNIKSIISEASKLTKPFSEETSKNLENLEMSNITEQSESNIKETMENLLNQNIKQAQKTSNKSKDFLQMMNEEINNIYKQFQQETINEMSKKFQALMQDILYLSSEQEKLKSDVNSSSRNSPRLRELASKQQLLQDQLQSITFKMLELSKETFSITPSMGRRLGKTNSEMQNAKTNLSNRNINQTKQNQENAITSLNESAFELFNGMQNMQNSGSSGGYEQFLQMMQEMSEKQQGLNEQGMQLGLGQLSQSLKNKMMQEMLQKQQGVRKTLENLMKKMRNSGQQHGAGSLKGIKNEMDKVLNDLKNNKYDHITKKRQKQILSRMLDGQLSITQRGYKEERKSISAKSFNKTKEVGGLPSDLGQRKSLTMEALNNATKAGYTKEHQIMIKKYFNSLEQLNTNNNIINE